MGSKRLPGKALCKILGKPSILHLCDRLKRTKSSLPIVICIPDTEEDQKLKTVLENYGMTVFVGESDNPLKRMILAAEKYDFKTVIRITHDDILIDTTVMERMSRYHIKNQFEYTYTSMLPSGCGCEIFNLTALKRARDKTPNIIFEGVSRYFRNDNYKWGDYIPNYEYHHDIRLTMDTPEDLSVLRIMLQQLSSLPSHNTYSYTSNLGTLDFIHFMNRNYYIAKINQTPRVSVYTPNYNNAEYLKLTIDSVLNQNFRELELIIIDDASTDKSMEVLKQYIYPGSPVNIIFNDRHRGHPVTCDRAIKQARGKYILRLEPGDILCPDAIVKLHVDIVDNPSMDGVGSGYLEIDKDSSVVREVLLSNSTQEKSADNPNTILIHKRKFDDFRNEQQINGVENYDLSCKFIETRKIKCLDETLWKKRIFEDDST
jgi:spore coat polysaccharide biosynthesis protein SpsF (cytidylyltransferase family)